MSLLRETMALADSARVLVRDVRATPEAPAPGHGARLDSAIRDVAALRWRTESAAIDRIARARTRRACLRPASSPWERRKADQVDVGPTNAEVHAFKAAHAEHFEGLLR